MNKLTLKRLRRTDANAILRLQKKATDPHTFTPRDIVSVKYAIRNERVVGIHDNGVLIAYSILETASDYDIEVAKLTEIEDTVYKFSGTVVHPNYRGRGLQKMLLRSHIDFCMCEGNAVMAYVHRLNTPSIRSLTHVGLEFRLSAFIETKVDYRDIYVLTNPVDA